LPHSGGGRRLCSGLPAMQGGICMKLEGARDRITAQQA
jgi:hypothetical protein